MTSSWHRCEATRPDGERCCRVAQPGSMYCHSHRHYQPKVRMPPTANQRIEHHLFSCADCNRLIPPGRALTFTIRAKPPAEEGLVLCEPCFRLRQQIETRIAEICSSPGGLPKERIYADLEHFGVDLDLVEAARSRMHADGRLVSA